MRSEAYREARNVLFERGWSGRGTYGAHDEVCILQSIALATGRGHWGFLRGELPELQQALGVVNFDHIHAWNDRTAEHIDEVFEALEKAEKIAAINEESI